MIEPAIAHAGHWLASEATFAHAGHWLVQLAYLAPLGAFGVALAVGKMRERRERRLDPEARAPES